MGALLASIRHSLSDYVIINTINVTGKQAANVYEPPT